MKLNETIVREFREAFHYKQHDKYAVNDIDFSEDGNWFISSGNSRIVIYKCQDGEPTSHHHFDKYGVGLVNFTHDCDKIIHSSTNIDDGIRYVQLSVNKYITYFIGHTKKVVVMELSPSNDIFISGALDKTIRLWDLRIQNSQGLMQVPGRPSVNFDPQGLTFAVGTQGCIKMYDVREIDRGPFATFLYQQEDVDWTGLKFSPNGKYILISTNSDFFNLVDAYTGEPLFTLRGFENTKKEPLEASFSPDSNFVVAGSSNRKLNIWNTETGFKVASLDSSHKDTIKSVLFNPKLAMIASACSNVAFWLPQVNK